VFRAFDSVLERIVAVKVLAPALAATSPARKRFTREARSAGQVRHENVVAIHVVGEEPLPHLVMDYIPGETLEQRIDRTGPMDVSEVLAIGCQIALGLAAAHEKELVHRDVKPGNVLIEAGPYPRVKLTDFGLARTVDDASVSQSGTVVGTPLYMSPEQARGESIDHRSDLFSLGSVLYTMCTGHPPFRANTSFGVIKRVIEDVPRPIPEVIPEVPEALCAVIVKLHAKDPAERFQSARAVADQLAALAQGSPVPAAPTPVPTPVPRAAPASATYTRRLVAVVGVLAVAILAGLGIDSLLRQGRPPESVEKGNSEPSPLPAPGAEPVKQPPLAVAPFDAKEAREHQEVWAKHLGVPVEFTNAVGMKMCLIPPGKYLQGSPEDEIDTALDQLGDGYGMVLAGEEPQHRVILDAPFALGATEVTRGQFRQFVQDTRYKTDAERDPPPGQEPLGNGLKMGRWVRGKEYNWDTNPGYERKLTDADPVVNVTWADAMEFCKWLSRKDGRTYTLPTEAQWEYACRAGTQTPWWTGGWMGVERHLLTATRYEHDRTEVGFQPVASCAPNPFGLYDMHGNVEEWCSDWYAEYPDMVLRNPTGPETPTEKRVVRSNNFNVKPAGMRSGYRLGADPNLPVANRGFRVALIGDLKAKK
jgi:formylglycine-generating enzyme required for sulfatase activity